mmetsp:Transcript_2314/g.3433  ORF Transcript_2314/g.3433 Transcript_2314/m.3433 type:complete len:205 (+) Transcript_2314:256-870(+)
MYHKSKNSQHGGTSIVELYSTLDKLGLLIEGIPSVVKRFVTEVTGELGRSSNILHYEKLKGSNEGNNLKKSSLGDGVDGGPSIRDGVEGISGLVDVSGKVDSGAGDDVSKEGKLGNTSVLDLNITESVETLLVGIIKESKRIEKSKWGLNSNLSLESSEGSGGLGYLGRSEGGGGGGKGGGDDKLHVDDWFVKIDYLICEIESD